MLIFIIQGQLPTYVCHPPFIDESDDELSTTQETLEGHSDERILH